MAFDSSNPAWEADTHFAMLEQQAQERHLAKLMLGQRIDGYQDDARQVGPSVIFDTTSEELQDLADVLSGQQKRYYGYESNYLFYLSSRPLDNYRGIKSITWSLYQPLLED